MTDHTIKLKIDAKAIVPILQTFKEYFDAKYPCTDETCEGLEMTLEDEFKFQTYEYLLDKYKKSKQLYDELYENAMKLLEDNQ